MRHAFITGFPGFLAGQLAEALILRTESLTLLAEARFAERARAEAERIAAAAGGSPERLRVVTGDITAGEGLGLEVEAARRLRRECDTVFHLAAIYDLSVGAELAEKVNVTGTANVNAFVRSLSGLERYNYVSTFAVSGRRTGIIRESELEHDAGFFNHYEATKYRAEVAVQRLIREEGLPVSVLRPAVVVGRSDDGRTAKFDGPYMVLKVLQRLPWPLNRFNFGAPDLYFQMVPVDFVVAAMVEIASNPEAAGKTFHLTDPAPTTTEEILGLFGKALNGTPAIARLPKPAVRLATASGIFAPLGLQKEASPYFFHRARWDCVNTLDVLDGTGIEVPPPASYMDVLVRYFLEHSNGGRR